MKKKRKRNARALWVITILEWLVFFSTIAWLFGMTFFI